ncbi:hypothetical protein Cpir12675_001072 [Ceratocystis pirilliformis]|uniref:Amidohydrolase-related domain-containing protein n=1 Tax=Ceratocystis pirilliformis TaxID=259994 RepID=A0ABR3ZIN0_9PEZI
MASSTSDLGGKKPQRQHQLFLGNFIHSKSREELEYWHNTAVAVSTEGVILAIEKDCDEAKARAELLSRLKWSPSDVEVTVTSEKQFFFPGLIDTHVHASQYPNVGIFGKSTLLDWLDTYTFPLESSLADRAKAQRVYTACVRRTLSHGTTAASYFATQSTESTNVLADVCLSLGQRALIGRVCMDNAAMCPEYYRDESAETARIATEKSIDYIRKIDPTYEIIKPILTPRFAPSCSSASMTALGKIAAETGLPVQTHISENKPECELVNSLFPEAGSYTNVYENSQLLTPRTILAHGIWLSEEEAALISQRGSKISHCPCSNTSITSGTARIRWLWNHGIDVGLGTDMSGGYSPSVLDAARQAALVSRHVAMGMAEGKERESSKLTVEEVLYLATKGGAIVMGMEDRVGSFAVGMHWDAIQIKLATITELGDREEDGGEAGNVDIFGWESWDEMVAKWLYNGDDRNCKKVWVKGRLVHQRK